MRGRGEDKRRVLMHVRQGTREMKNRKEIGEAKKQREEQGSLKAYE